MAKADQCRARFKDNPARRAKAGLLRRSHHVPSVDQCQWSSECGGRQASRRQGKLLVCRWSCGNSPDLFDVRHRQRNQSLEPEPCRCKIGILTHAYRLHGSSELTKHWSAEIEPAPMRICLKYARVFWAIAILLMAGGQAVHAYEDVFHPSKHASERHTSESEQPACPTGHTTCCHGHSHVIGALAEAPNFSIVASSSDYYFDRVDSVVEGPIREIDYPPQLS